MSVWGSVRVCVVHGESSERSRRSQQVRQRLLAVLASAEANAAAEQIDLDDEQGG